MISAIVFTDSATVTPQRLKPRFFAQQDVDKNDRELVLLDRNSSVETSAVAVRYLVDARRRYVFEPCSRLSAGAKSGHLVVPAMARRRSSALKTNLTGNSAENLALRTAP